VTIYCENQQSIARRINRDCALSNWQDWRWQIKHSIQSIDSFESLLDIRFPPDERRELALTLRKFPLSITPYYLSLIDTDDYRNCPVFRQAFPSPAELNIGNCDLSDPLAEDQDSPAPGITHRYPDRVLFHVSNVCSMYCRHCTRKRKVGDDGHIPGREELEQGLAYIRATPQVRDVILSGGDPLLLADEKLDGILKALRAIPHVEIIRIGSRVPVVLPQRITPALVRVLRKYHPLFLNTHFNHPDEITEQAAKACARLADAGIPLGNQSVLLRGVNDDPAVMKRLMQKLLAIRVRPYYLYQADMVQGTNHFRTSVEEGLEIIRALRGHSSGLGVPAYVIDAPGGGGKIPLLPDYLQSLGEEVVLMNYLGETYRYANVAPEVPEERRRVANEQG